MSQLMGKSAFQYYVKTKKVGKYMLTQSSGRLSSCLAPMAHSKYPDWKKKTEH